MTDWKLSARMKAISAYEVWQQKRPEYKSGQPITRLNKVLVDKYRSLSAEELTLLSKEAKRNKKLAEQRFIEKYMSADDFNILYRGDFRLVRKTLQSLRKDLIQSEENRQFYIDILYLNDIRASYRCVTDKNRQTYLLKLELVSSAFA